MTRASAAVKRTVTNKIINTSKPPKGMSKSAWRSGAVRASVKKSKSKAKPKKKCKRGQQWDDHDYSD